MLGGLVGITASCAYVAPGAAGIVGVVSGLIVPVAVTALERGGIDDPVGAIAVHAGCGAWGLLAVGIFANGSFGEGLNGVSGPVQGALFGDPRQLLAQAIGMATSFVGVFCLAFVYFRVVERLIGNRVDNEVEWQGLDSLEMGSDAYPRE
ncbi:MAG: ammonium transporter, partial [Polyangiaceae bacterium]